MARMKSTRPIWIAAITWTLLLWTAAASTQDGNTELVEIRELNGLTLLNKRQFQHFTGALAIYGSGGGGQESSGSSSGGGGSSSSGQGQTQAVPAQCPADHPVSCTAIQEPD